MAKVCIFSQHLFTQPAIDVPLFEELCRRGIDTKYVVHKDDTRLLDKRLKGLLPGSLEVVSSYKQAASVVDAQGLLFCRFGYKGMIGDLAQKVKSSGKKVLMYDVGGVDIFFRDVPATHIIAKTEWHKHQCLKKLGKKYVDIFPEGSIQFDDLFRLKKLAPDRVDFCKKYGIAADKKIIVLTPANPGEAWMVGIKDDYKKIVDIVVKHKEYELIIKGHPSDYALIKNQHYNNKHSWDVFAKGSKVIDPEDGYLLLSLCDAVLNIRSSFAMEVPAMNKPLININSDKYIVNWPKSNDRSVMRNININQLETELLNLKYTVNETECEKYTQTYCDPCMNGNAYVRTADIIEKLV